MKYLIEDGSVEAVYPPLEKNETILRVILAPR